MGGGNGGIWVMNVRKSVKHIIWACAHNCQYYFICFYCQQKLYFFLLRIDFPQNKCMARKFEAVSLAFNFTHFHIPSRAKCFKQAIYYPPEVSSMK